MRDRAKSDGVPDCRIQIGPLHGVARVNRDGAVKETHHGKRLLSATGSGNFTHTRGDRRPVGNDRGREQISDRVIMFGLMLMVITVCQQ